MFVGGWQFGRFITPSLLLGGNLGVGFNALPENGCALDGDGLRFTLGMTIGPNVDWYPFNRGFHVSVNGGYANYEQDSMVTTHGVGGTLAIGYDWPWFRFKTGEYSRFGLALQASAMRMTGSHTIVMPALVMTLGID
jgi:hypothetical protein